MYASLRSVLFGFAIISTATTVSAVQLASFTPRIDVSNAQCRAAYTTTIEGCTADDFASSARCSEACIQGLKKIGDVVKRVCKDVDVGETSIIGVFQNGLGVQALCPLGAAPASPPASSSAKAPAQTSAQPPASKPTSTSAPAPAPETPASTLVTSSSTSTSISSSQSEAVESASTSSQGLVLDPDPTSVSGGSPTDVAPPPASSAALPGQTEAPNAQLSNAASGGGSPFDVQAVSEASSQLRVINLMLAAFVGSALLSVLCA